MTGLKGRRKRKRRVGGRKRTGKDLTVVGPSTPARPSSPSGTEKTVDVHGSRLSRL